MKSLTWDEVPLERLTDGISRRVITGEKVMLGRIYLDKGATVPAHHHENEQITHVLSGVLRFVIEGEVVVVAAGETVHIASNEEHSAEALEDTDEIDAFSPIRLDWLDGTDAYIRGGAAK
jgi:quercetin dioxygenase-like cupin family protein